MTHKHWNERFQYLTTVLQCWVYVHMETYRFLQLINTGTCILMSGKRLPICVLQLIVTKPLEPTLHMHCFLRTQMTL